MKITKLSRPRFLAIAVVSALLYLALVGCDLAGSLDASAGQPTSEATATLVPAAPSSQPATPVASAPPLAAAADTPVSLPTVTAVSVEPTAPPALPADTPAPADTPTALPSAPTDTPVVEANIPAPPQSRPTQVVVNGVAYDAYIPAATKKNQYYHFTCEFDAAWVIFKTYGIDVTLNDQINAVGLDTSIEPRYEETKNGVVIYGGDVFNSYSGDYNTNFMARTTGKAMRKAFERYGLKTTLVNTQAALEAALLRGELVWIKTTVDFKPGRAATWVMPNGQTYQTVLGNDHAVVVMGFNSEGALIRDVLGPTSTNWQRQYEYLVPWPKFLASWGQQENDGVAVARP